MASKLSIDPYIQTENEDIVTSPKTKSMVRANSETDPPVTQDIPRTTKAANPRFRSKTLGSAFSVSPPDSSLPPYRGLGKLIVESFSLDGKVMFPIQDSFAYFRKNDMLPKLHRKIFYALNQRHLDMKKVNKGNRVIQDAPSIFIFELVKNEKSKRIGIGGKLNALLRNKKQKRTRTGIFHMLHLAIHDIRFDDADLCLENLSGNTLVKKRPRDANRAFLHAMINRMQSVCVQMLEKGFPFNVNNPVMGAHDAESTSKFYFPSYFQIAVAFELVDVVKSMLKLKADVNLSWYQVTPLQNACLKGNEQLIRLLIDNGASPNQSLGLEDYYLLSKLKPCKYLTQTSPTSPGPKVNDPKDCARQSGQKGPLKIPNDYVHAKEICLFELAALRGHLKIASYLLENTSPDIVEKSCFGLLNADDYVWTKQMLKAGVSSEQKDSSGCTPLHIAARKGRLNVVIALVCAGAKMNEKGLNGWTPLHEAAAYAHIEVVQYLIYKGADVTIVNNQNETPKELAFSRGFDTMTLNTLFDPCSSISVFLEKESAIQNFEVPVAVQILDSVKSKSDKGRFGLSFLSREKSGGEKSSSSSASLHGGRTSSGKRTFFSSKSSKAMQ